ncbi:MAG: hypothetical protein RPT13_08500 [SAR324 cluster bacterium]
METDFNINQKSFKTLDNSSGLSNSETIFTYSQSGCSVTGEYKGGEIEFGNIVGKFISPNTIELLFQCRTNSNELLSGSSKGVIQKDSNGKLTISFKWHWLSGSEGSGHSYYEEV